MVNQNFLNLQENYLFSTIAKKVKKFTEENPNKKIIKLGIGDVTLPLPKKIIEALTNAVNEMGEISSFKGYPPEYGYEFLKEKIIENEYIKRGIDIKSEEIFISDGAKSDLGNILDIFKKGITVAITTPVYPVYVDTNTIAGNKIIYMEMNEQNDFKPKLPKEKVDLIYLCFPNNPTGVALKKEELKTFVDYAIENNSIILFDAAYTAFRTEENIPYSIYEIEGARKIAIEFKSFSKMAGFTGLRCGYTVVPKQTKLNEVWARRQSTKFNGVSYIIQKAAEAVYSEEGFLEIQQNIKFYLENAKIMKNRLKELGYTVYGGENAPYIWCKTENNLNSWEYFDYLLKEKQIVVTPRKRIWKFRRGIF